MNVPTDSLDNVIPFSSTPFDVQKSSDISLAELLTRCVRRPADEYAWQEFVRRFHPTIRHSVKKTLCFKTAAGMAADGLCTDEVIDRIVQMVYHKLVENRCQALRSLDGTLLDSMRSYLMIISINAVRDYLQRGRPS